MDRTAEPLDDLIRSAARRLHGHQRRLYLAEVADALCGGSPRCAERRFGWGRATGDTGLREARQGIRCLENFAAKGRTRCEVKDPGLAADIRAVVEPRTQADPELTSPRRYTTLSAAEVRQALLDGGRPAAAVPGERTMRDILNRMGYRLTRIRTGKPLKKLPETDAVFADVAAARDESRGDPAVLEISVDAKAKVPVGDYARGGKTRTSSAGDVEQGWDHDPPATEKVTPLGILVLLTGALTLTFGAGGTSDVWADALVGWWRGVRSRHRGVRRLVVYLDNGPENNGRRTQFLKRAVQFADWSGLEVRLVYYPPYHSKYNPVERCWSALEQKWGGALLNSWAVILAYAARMRWCGRRPRVERLFGAYPPGVTVPAKEMKGYEARLERSAAVPKYDILIRPKVARGG